MSTSKCRRRRKGVLAAARNELTRLRDLSSPTEEFLQVLEEFRVPIKTQRVLLSAVDDVCLPQAYHSPRFLARLAARFMSPLEFAVIEAWNPNYSGPTTRGVARVISDLVRAFDIDGCSRIDRLLTADLQQLAASLEAIAS